MLWGTQPAVLRLFACVRYIIANYNGPRSKELRALARTPKKHTKQNSDRHLAKSPQFTQPPVPCKRLPTSAERVHKSIIDVVDGECPCPSSTDGRTSDRLGNFTHGGGLTELGGGNVYYSTRGTESETPTITFPSAYTRYESHGLDLCCIDNYMK